MTRKKILLIEDSKTDADAAKVLLEKEGMEVTVAATGKEGLDKAQKLKPDLVVLDLVLPDISGIEVCKKLKQNPDLKKAIIVVLSIKDDVATIAKAFEAGADDYVIKPAVREFLPRKVKLYLGLS